MPHIHETAEWDRHSGATGNENARIAKRYALFGCNIPNLAHVHETAEGDRHSGASENENARIAQKGSTV